MLLLVMAFQVLELLLEDGSSPYAIWFNGLDAMAAAKVTTAKLRRQQGNLSNVKWFSGIGEYKIDWGPGFLIYLGRDGNEILLLLGGGIKKGQQTDIKRALKFWGSYRIRKGATIDKWKE